MNIPRKTMAFLLSAALALSLASCGQGEVNEKRLPSGGQGGSAPGGVQSESTPGQSQNHDDLEDVQPFDFDTYVDVEDNTFRDNRLELRDGQGTVLYTVTSAKLYDSPEEAGIGEEPCAAWAKESYDHYIRIDMTVRNVDVPEAEDEYNVKNFILAGHVDFYFVNSVWFSLGGLAESDANGYFYYHLPPAGEAMEISLAFGLSDGELAAFRESDGIRLCYDLPANQQLKLEGLL